MSVRVYRPAVIVCVDGRVRVDRLFDTSLGNLQRHVKGNITCLDINRRTAELVEREWNVRLGKRPCIVANDEALLFGMPVNPIASVLFSMSTGQPEDSYVFGPVVIVDCP